MTRDRAFAVAGAGLVGLLAAALGASTTSAAKGVPVSAHKNDSSDLEPDFARKVEQVIALSATDGVDLRRVEGSRSPQRQAQLYGKGRTASDMQAAAARLDGYGAPWLASLMRAAPADHAASVVTKALPGEGFHAFGLAEDLGWFVDGRYEGSSYRGGAQNGYAIMGKHAESLGLGWGARIKGLADSGHVQAVPIGQTPITRYGGWPAVDKLLKERFG